MKRSLPKMTCDEDAEDLLAGDLTEYLTSENFNANFTPVSFEFAPKDETISIRLSKGLLEAIKVAASKRGIGYQKFIRESMERVVRDLA